MIKGSLGRSWPNFFGVFLFVKSHFWSYVSSKIAQQIRFWSWLLSKRFSILDALKVCFQNRIAGMTGKNSHHFGSALWGCWNKNIPFRDGRIPAKPLWPVFGSSVPRGTSLCQNLPLKQATAWRDVFGSGDVWFASWWMAVIGLKLGNFARKKFRTHEI